MPYDPSGNFTRDYDWTTDRNNGVKVRADRMDGEFNNVATALNQVILRNGAAAFTGNVQMGGNSIVSLADGTVGTPAIRLLASPTSGLYSPGLDRVALTASGTNRVEASATGVLTTGTLTHTGAATFSSTLGVTGVITGGSLNTTGAANVGTLAVTGGATVGGTFAVTGGSTFTGEVSVAAGLVGAPAIRFTASPTTGLYSPALGTAALTASGVNRVEANTTGVILTGANTNTGALTVTGALSANSTLAVTGAATVGGTLGVTGGVTFGGALNFPTSPGIVQVAGVNVFGLTNGGNVGINTTAPNKAFKDRALTINGATNSILEFARADLLNAYIYSDASNFQLDAGTGQLILITGSIPRLTISTAGAAAFSGTASFTGKVTASNGAYSAGNVYVATGVGVGFSGDNDTRASILSPTGADLTIRSNNISAITVNSLGAVSTNNALNVGANAAVVGGVFSGGAAADSFRGGTIRARDINNFALDVDDLTGAHTVRMRPDVAGVNFITSYGTGTVRPLALSGRQNTSDFVLNADGSASFGGNVSSGGGVFSGGAAVNTTYGAVFRARDANQFSIGLQDLLGTTAFVIQPNYSGVHLVTAYNPGADLPVAVSARRITTDFQMLANGNASFGGSVSANGDLTVGVTSTNNTLSMRGTVATFLAGVINGTTTSRLDTSTSGLTVYTLTNTPIVLAANSAARLTVASAETYLNNKQAPTVDTAIGYLGVPQVGGAAKIANYTAVLGDAGQHILFNAAALTATIPANVAVAYPVGTTLTFVNINAGALSIAITTDTLTLAGTTTVGTRTLAQNGIATAIKTGATSWHISGPGLT